MHRLYLNFRFHLLNGIITSSHALFRIAYAGQQVWKVVDTLGHVCMSRVYASSHQHLTPCRHRLLGW